MGPVLPTQGQLLSLEEELSLLSYLFHEPRARKAFYDSGIRLRTAFAKAAMDDYAAGILPGIETGFNVNEKSDRWHVWDEKKRAEGEDSVFINNELDVCFSHYLNNFGNCRDVLSRYTLENRKSRFARWHDSCRSQAQAELPSHISNSLLHLPFAIELSSGCSVGCSFCSLSAKRLSNIFSSNQENLNHFRNVVRTIFDVVGNCAANGILYWATDPLDNPSYEIFASTFHEESGVFPITTSALFPRKIERFKMLIELSESKGCSFNRASILSLSDYNKLTTRLSYEELLFIEILPQTKTSLLPKVRAGRHRKRVQVSQLAASGAGKEYNVAGEIEGESNCCITGLLVSLPSKEIKLISPCAATNECPDGVCVHASSVYQSIEDLKFKIERTFSI